MVSVLLIKWISLTLFYAACCHSSHEKAIRNAVIMTQKRIKLFNSNFPLEEVYSPEKTLTEIVHRRQSEIA
jgi:hypothetical protein